jgi:hypothetical protein
MGQPGQSKFAKKCKALQYCDSNKFIELTVGSSHVLMSKAAINNICSNKHKASREYTYANTKIQENRLKPIQPNYRKYPLRLFSFVNEEITMLQCYVLTCGWTVTAFLAPPRSQRLRQGPRSPHPKAGPA